MGPHEGPHSPPRRYVFLSQAQGRPDGVPAPYPPKALARFGRSELAISLGNLGPRATRVKARALVARSDELFSMVSQNLRLSPDEVTELARRWFASTMAKHEERLRAIPPGDRARAAHERHLAKDVLHDPGAGNRGGIPIRQVGGCGTSYPAPSVQRLQVRPGLAQARRHAAGNQIGAQAVTRSAQRWDQRLCAQRQGYNKAETNSIRQLASRSRQIRIGRHVCITLVHVMVRRPSSLKTIPDSVTNRCNHGVWWNAYVL